MNKIYRSTKSLIALSLLAGMKLSAQIGGNVTIDQTQPSSATNFTSFTQFVATLAAGGVTSAVTADVVPNTGPYIEQITVPAISGASAASPVIVEGNGNTITFSSSNSTFPYTIGLGGANYFRVNNLNIHATGTYAYALHLWNNSSNNVFTACTFSVPYNTTSSNHIPISISANQSYYYYNGNGGSNNTIQTSTISNGYFAVTIYGGSSYNCASPNTNAPNNNKFLNNVIRDFYQYGFYMYYYMTGTEIKNNDMSCPTITNHTSRYFLYTYATNQVIIDGNKLHDPFLTNTAYTGTFYGIYCNYNSDSYWTYCNLPSRFPYFVRNNLINDIRSNGTIYAIYFWGADGDIYNNTISLDDAASTSGSTTYGIYTYGQQGYYRANVKNNIISITRGGSGTKYAIGNACYCTGTDVEINRNDIYMNAPAGNNYYGYVTTTALQSNYPGWASQVSSGWSVNPQYVNMAAQDYHPTNTLIANQSIVYPSPNNVVFDNVMAIRNPTAPDVGALEFSRPACSGVPSNITLTGPTYSLCPGETANLMLGNLATAALSGITFSWNYSSVSNVGPWTPVTGATSFSYQTPANFAPGYYQFVMTCTNPGGGAATPVQVINIAAPSFSTVPYFEGFEGIGQNNRLPNCSWISTSLGGAANTATSAGTGYRTPRTGSSFAYFSNSSPGTNYYYTNGIQLNAGVTYSASMWYFTEPLNGYGNWTDLSIMVGTGQSASTQTVVASTGNAAIALQYKSLSNTFTVAQSGTYYVAIRATGNSGGAPNLSWDDLLINVPCTLPENTGTLAITANNASVCSGAPLNLTASGAGSYTWNTGATTAVLNDTPINNGSSPIMVSYNVTGMNAASGCTSNVSKNIQVKPGPVISVSSFPALVCSGKPVNLTAQGANTYTWSTTDNGPQITKTPTSSVSYTVLGTNSFNCTGTTSHFVSVKPNPTVTALPASVNMCANETATLTASGAGSYQWSSPTQNLNANPVIIGGANQLTGLFGYTVTGTDANGCSSTSVVQVNVEVCAGISENGMNQVKVYPNPTSGELFVESGDIISDIRVTDVTGRVIFSQKADSQKASIQIDVLSAGVYYINVTSAGNNQIVKVIKQ
jgi:hypothetical protein